VRSMLVSACWGVARRLLVMRRSWVDSHRQLRRLCRSGPLSGFSALILRHQRGTATGHGPGTSASATHTAVRILHRCLPPARVHHSDMRTSTGTRRLDQNARICPVPGLPRLDREAAHNRRIWPTGAGAQWPLMKWPPLWRRPGWPGQASRGRRRQRAASVRSVHGYLVCSLRGFIRAGRGGAP